MNNNIVQTCLSVVVGIALLAVGSASGLVNSALAQATMDNMTNATTTAQGNMTAGATNMTGSNTTGSGNISGTGNEGF
jgi:hypothetical protein